jgi:ABC-2 type transport system ATP-binding protein
MDSIISIKGLTKTYNAKEKGYLEALKSIDLEIPKGKIMGLLGPNGAGKSTIINILAGITVKTSGKVIVNGIDLDSDPINLRYNLGIVPQEVLIDPFFTVFQTLEYYAGYYGVPKEKRRTLELLEALSLKDKAKSTPRRLSGGMRRRLMVAKALVHNPPILILDEPTAGVDVELREQLWNYVRKLNKSGTTILLTTHYLEEAEELCERIAIINKGQIIACDDMEKLKSRITGKKLIIKLNEAPASIPASLNKYNSSIRDSSIVIEYTQNEGSFGEILKSISASNLDIKDISTEEADLEDVFKQLINEPSEKGIAA